MLIFAAGAVSALLAVLILLRLRARSEGGRISDLRQELETARVENTVMAVIAQHASDGLVIQDIQGRIEWSNPAYSRMTGYSAEELRGRKPQEFVLPPEDRLTPEEIEDFRYDISSGALDSFEIIRNVRKNGEFFWNQLGFAVVDHMGTREPKVIVIARDVTEQIEREEALKRAKEDIQRRAEHDILTGLPNRMKLAGYFASEMQAAGDSGERIGVLHVDLDRFKKVNDALGHDAGDAVLVHAANVMSAQVRKKDLVCRFGGDEFIIVCPGLPGLDALETLAGRIIRQLTKPMQWGGQSIAIGASIGIALSNSQTRDQNEVMKQADIALYEAKNRGRNGYVCYTPDLGETVARRNAISSDLGQAIAGNEISVVLQPQFDLKHNRVRGLEALVRWYHPARGVLLPAEFLPAAEIQGCMQAIDQIAIDGALDALKMLRGEGHEGMSVSINVSARTLTQKGYVDKLKWEVETRGLEPRDVVVEVLETIVIEGRDNVAAQTIAALSEAGFAVELDDFGIGYSGLVNLTRLPIQGVKIDRSLVQDLPFDSTAQTVVRAIFRLCEDLDLSVVSEGVERSEQAQFLQQIGGHVVQGFGIARPMAAKDLLGWMNRLREGMTLPVLEGAEALRRSH